MSMSSASEQGKRMADQPNEWQQALAAIDLSAIESSVIDNAEARARGLEMKARFLEAFHAESDLEGASPPPAPPSPVTGRFSVPQDDTAEARTTDMPGVRPDLTPNKTQI